MQKLSSQLQWEMQKAAFKTFVIGIMDEWFQESQARMEAKRLTNNILNEAFKNYDELPEMDKQQFK